MTIGDMSLPPGDSKITVASDSNGQPMLVLPVDKARGARFGTAAFLSFWLCGWAAGETFASVALFKTFKAKQHGVDLFLFGWLGFWTLGGGAAIYTLYKTIRRPLPETMTFTNPGLVYDTGSAFNANMRNPRQRNYWKRKTHTFSREELATLTLRETDTSNRLTIDQGNERIDIGRSLTEVEREWLFKEIKQRCKV
ncbi:MAG TPA: hypothetical protein VG733_11955 [Chthoniobacteraceae bacterium]|nr:hypothetical protein [Chthoniobacteraceae bacterium]